MTVKDYKQLQGRGAFAVKRAKNAPKRRRSPFGAVGSPNKTEVRYNAEMLNGQGAYEPFSLKLPGGSRYTPDFVTWDAQGRMTCHEVKGSFRFASESRAVAVVRECAHHFPHITFIWATLEKGGEWSVFKANEGGADATLTGAAESERK